MTAPDRVVATGPPEEAAGSRDEPGMGPPARRPEVRATARVLTAGTMLSAACFLVGTALAVIGRPTETLDPRRLDLIASSAMSLQPAGWSMLGVLLVLVTPALALLVTYVEMRTLQPRAALAALGVLGILGAATVIAVVGG